MYSKEEELEPAPRFELGVMDLQSIALPLGHAGVSLSVESYNLKESLPFVHNEHRFVPNNLVKSVALPWRAAIKHIAMRDFLFWSPTLCWRKPN